MTGAGGTAVQLHESKAPAGSRHPNPCFWHGPYLDRLLSRTACLGKPEAVEPGRGQVDLGAIVVWFVAVIFTRRGKAGCLHSQTAVECHSQGEQTLVPRKLDNRGTQAEDNEPRPSDLDLSTARQYQN